MKTFLLALVILASDTVFGQNAGCSKLWLGDPSDSIDVIKKTAEGFLDAQMKLSSDPEVKTIIELRDSEGLALMKVWMKPKKVVAGGSVATVYAVSSFKVTGAAERIQALFSALKERVAQCTTESTNTSVVFGTGKMFVENQGGDWSKKNLQMSTLTITSK